MSWHTCINVFMYSSRFHVILTFEKFVLLWLTCSILPDWEGSKWNKITSYLDLSLVRMSRGVGKDVRRPWLSVLAHVYGRVSFQQVDVFLQVVQLFLQRRLPFHLWHRVREHRQQQELLVQFGPVGFQSLHTKPYLRGGGVRQEWVGEKGSGNSCSATTPSVRRVTFHNNHDLLW